MHNSKKLLLMASVILLVFSFPAKSGPIGAQLVVCTGVFNDFAPATEFNPCWNTIGNVAAGMHGVGPTIATSGGATMADLQTFIGAASFQFSNFTSDGIGVGSAIQDGFMLAGTSQLSLSLTTSSPSGSIGFAIIQDHLNAYTFITLFDSAAPLSIFGLGSSFTLPSLPAGSYELTIGIANATCGAIAAFSCIIAAQTGPEITGITIQDVSAPEPAAGWLLASGLAGLILFRRRILR